MVIYKAVLYADTKKITSTYLVCHICTVPLLRLFGTRVGLITLDFLSVVPVPHMPTLLGQNYQATSTLNYINVRRRRKEVGEGEDEEGRGPLA